MIVEHLNPRLVHVALHWAEVAGMRDGMSRQRQANVPGGRMTRRVVKLSVAQDAALRVHATELGVSVPRLLVESTLSSFSGETLKERRDLLTALFTLQRGLAAAGNNINQIARVANSTGEIAPELDASLLHLRSTVKRINECLESLAITDEPS